MPQPLPYRQFLGHRPASAKLVSAFDPAAASGDSSGMVASDNFDDAARNQREPEATA